MKYPAVNLLWLLPFVFVNSIATFAQDRNELGSAEKRPAIEKPAATESDEYVELTRELLQTECESFGLPAMWVARYEREGPSFVASYGFRKAGEMQPVTDEDLLHLGSCTKAMTAVLVAQQVSAGAITWTDTLGELFPGVEGLADSEWSDVTVEQLLWHRSGAPANAPWHTIDAEHPDPIDGRQAVVEWLLKQKRGKAGFLYSNVGYALLGHILEAKSGQTWESLIGERLFQPLGIRTGGFGPVIGSEALAQPWGHAAKASSSGLFGSFLHALTGGKMKNEFTPLQIDNATPLGPAGRVHMSLGDWMRFVQLFTDHSEDRHLLAIKDADWQKLVTPGDSGDYAGGWITVQRKWAQGLALSHSGSNTTWYCVAWVAPKKDLVLLVATNAYADNVPKACDEVIAALLDK